MQVIVDTEWSDLQATRLWCIVARDVNTDKEYIFDIANDPDWEAAQRLLEGCSRLIGHNIIGFDLPALRRYFGRDICPNERAFDTLVISRLLNTNIEGGHSLEAWALRLNTPVKKTGIEDFSIYTPELLSRCRGDVQINKKLYEHFRHWTDREEFQSAINTEHQTAWLCGELEKNGFAVNYTAVLDLLHDVGERLNVLDAELKDAFPPKRVLKTTIKPRFTKSGDLFAADSRRLVAGGYNLSDIRRHHSYPIFENREFNPASHKDIIERLNEAGWKPTERTKGHSDAVKHLRNKDGIRKARASSKIEHYREYGWKLSEENLKSLPDTAPEAARKLTQRLLLASRYATLRQWQDLARPTQDGQYRIHGRFNHIGAWTHRMSHANPNMANVPKAKPKRNPSSLDLLSDDINNQMRAMWIAPPGRRLVGVDADSIQMRIFAHYVNDPRLTKALIEGDKDDGTDIHSVHERALGRVCASRDVAKTFIYAWLLGAGSGKVAEIFECSIGEAKDAIEQFINFYPGLQQLKSDRIPADAARGYFIGLDGRAVVCTEERLVLAGYLQNGEAVIQKRAAQTASRNLKSQGIPFLLVNFVHDEFQIEVPDDDEIANYIQRTFEDAIVTQGKELNLNLPLGATGVQGYNWKDTH